MGGWVGGWFHHFHQVSRLSLYGHIGVLGLGHSPLERPTVQARGASLCCPSTNAICTSGQGLARCPRTTLEVGWWLRGFRQASSTLLVQGARRCHVALCVVCALGLSQLGARGSEAASRHAQSRNRSHDLSVPTLSPVALSGDPCVCVCVCVCVCGWLLLFPV